MRRRLLIRLATLLTAAALTTPAAEAPQGRPDVDLLRQNLESILSSGYRLVEPPQARLHEMMLRALRVLQGMLGTISQARPLAGLPEWTRPLITGVLPVLVGLIIAHLVGGLRRLLEGSAGRRGPTGPEPERMDPRSMLTRAEDASGRREFDEAISLLYLAVLLRLDRLGLLSHDPARTNWENLAALTGGGPNVRDSMAGLTREVDACIYGGRRASESTWRRAREWAEVVWRAGESA